MRLVLSIADRAMDIMAALAGVLVVFATLSVTADVVLRYLTARSFGWVDEITADILLYIAFLAAPWVLKHDGHVRMDLVLSRLSPRQQLVANTTTSCIGAVICLVLTWYGAKVTWQLYESKYVDVLSTVGQKYIITGIIPVGFFLLGIQFLRWVFTYWTSLRTTATGSASLAAKESTPQEERVLTVEG